MAIYFDAAKTAMRAAKHCVHLLNWAFEANTQLHPEPGGGGPENDRIGQFLKALAEDNPHLDVRILCWKSAMPVAATQHFFPFVDRQVFAGSHVKFVLDGKLPLGACHHQKMIIVDDALAFCGGGDIGPDRWDTPEHLDDDPRRQKTRRDNKCFDSRHEVMALVDGAAAQNLGQLFRDRWERATGEQLAACPPLAQTPWPSQIAVGFESLPAGVSRTSAAWRGHPEVRECETLHVEAIRRARSCIYMENQYFTSPLIARELAARLAEPDAPEVILVSTEHSPSYFDQMTMDRTRLAFLDTLLRADRQHRLRMFCPVTSMGRPIIVHAKLTIIDDLLLRVGSANINNRSMGFDTECDLSLEASCPEHREEIVRLRNALLAHWLGCTQATLKAAIGDAGGVGDALDRLRASGHCRLRPICPQKLGPLASFVAAFHLGDPIGPGDAWRPWKRRARLRAIARQVDAVEEARGVPEPPPDGANPTAPAGFVAPDGAIEASTSSRP